MNWRISILNALALQLLLACGAPAQTVVPRAPILKDVGIDQHLGVQIPPDLVFRDEHGREVRLGEFFGKRPLVLALVYYKCPMLCTMVLNDVTRAMNSMQMTCGENFDILTVSFDPNETPADAVDRKEQYIRAYRRPSAAAGWHFLTGTEPSIQKLTETVGFHYAWDPKYHQYAHASGLIVLTPDGKTSRYFYGIDYPPSTLELSLAEASQGKQTPVADRILLFCFHYDPTTGRYSVMINRVVQAGGILTVLVLGSGIWIAVRREKRGRVVA